MERKLQIWQTERTKGREEVPKKHQENMSVEVTG